MKPRLLLALDAVGAVITAAMIAFVLAPRPEIFGLPSAAAYGLAGLGTAFASYSVVGASLRAPVHHLWLRTIARANLSYCLLSAALMVVYRLELTSLGHLYLALEIAIVAFLARYELAVARRALHFHSIV